MLDSNNRFSFISLKTIWTIQDSSRFYIDFFLQHFFIKFYHFKFCDNMQEILENVKCDTLMINVFINLKIANF